ncbi:MAG: NADAR family protein [Bacteroidota bacterium]|nr:NADAR family protein [Bacteroidota bacterium]
MNIREYNVNEVVSFKLTTAPFGALSNMAQGFSLNINSVIIPSSEHLYQACKFPLFPSLQEEIFNQPTPKAAKLLAHKNNALNRQDWNSVRVKVMRWALEVKLLQNRNRFSAVLGETGNRAIIEDSNKDDFWGASRQGEKFIGTNALGRLLMELREKYIISATSLKSVNPPLISGFLILDSEIGKVHNYVFEDNYAFNAEELASDC